MLSRASEYTYSVEWSDEDQEYVATVKEFPSLSCLEPDRERAVEGLMRLVSEVLEDLEESGEPIPVPGVIGGD